MAYHFYFFPGKFPKSFNFSDSMEKRYLIELNIFKESAFYGFQKILLDNFPRNVHREWYVNTKIQDGLPRKISNSKQMFSVDFISGSRDFTQHLNFCKIKVIHEFSWNFPCTFSTKHCFEKYNKNNRSPSSFKRCDGPILPMSWFWFIQLTSAS